MLYGDAEFHWLITNWHITETFWFYKFIFDVLSLNEMKGKYSLWAHILGAKFCVYNLKKAVGQWNALSSAYPVDIVFVDFVRPLLEFW